MGDVLQAGDFESAVGYLRAAGMRPSFARLAVTKLLLEGCRDDVAEVVTVAEDLGLPLTLCDAAHALRDLRDAGALPGNGPDLGDAGRAGELLRVLANPARLRVLSLLAQGERSVGEIGDRLGLTQSALSQHLARLRDQSLVRTRRDRQRIFYSVPDTVSPSVLRLIAALRGACAAQAYPA